MTKTVVTHALRFFFVEETFSRTRLPTFIPFSTTLEYR